MTTVAAPKGRTYDRVLRVARSRSEPLVRVTLYSPGDGERLVVLTPESARKMGIDLIAQATLVDAREKEKALAVDA